MIGTPGAAMAYPTSTQQLGGYYCADLTTDISPGDRPNQGMLNIVTIRLLNTLESQIRYIQPTLDSGNEGASWLYAHCADNPHEDIPSRLSSCSRNSARMTSA